jgi:predicted TIM-barrel fold metal-dependent hydrolase
VIADAYNNIWAASGTSDYLTAATYDASRLMAAMDAGGVDLAVVCSLGQAIDNAYIAEAVASHTPRLVGFGQLNPRQGAVAAAVESVAAAGLRGLKLHPTMHGYHFADHGLLDPVLSACGSCGLVVLVNALDDPFCSPLAIEEIARGYPEVPVIIAHMGTVWNVTEAILVARRTDNIYLETSSAQLLDVQMAYDALGASRLLMGTDWPGSDFDLELMKIAKAVPDADDRRAVQGENLARLLGIEV